MSSIVTMFAHAVLSVPLPTTVTAAPPDHEIVAYRTIDTSKLEPPAISILTHAVQPDVVHLTRPTPSRNGPDAGSLLLYAIDSAADASGAIVRTVSVDQGRSWSARETVTLQGWPENVPIHRAAAPSAVQLDDGRIRLYFTAAAGNSDRPDPSSPPFRRPGLPDVPSPHRNEVFHGAAAPLPRILSAISNDGLTFAIEDGARFQLDGISDAEVLRLPVLPGSNDARNLGPWLLLVTRGQSTLLATSRDGLAWSRDEGFVWDGVRHAAASLISTDSRSVRLIGRGAAGVVSATFDPSSGEIKTLSKPAPSPEDSFDDPSLTSCGDGALLLVYTRESADKPAAPKPLPGLPVAPEPPLDPRFPPTHPIPKPEPVLPPIPKFPTLPK